MEVHKWLTEAHPDLAGRVIFVTGGAFTPKAREYLSDIDNLTFEKPFDTEQFKTAVNDRIQELHQTRNDSEE